MMTATEAAVMKRQASASYYERVGEFHNRVSNDSATVLAFLYECGQAAQALELKITEFEVVSHDGEIAPVLQDMLLDIQGGIAVLRSRLEGMVSEFPEVPPAPPFGEPVAPPPAPEKPAPLPDSTPGTGSPGEPPPEKRPAAAKRDESVILL